MLRSALIFRLRSVLGSKGARIVSERTWFISRCQWWSPSLLNVYGTAVGSCSSLVRNTGHGFDRTTVVGDPVLLSVFTPVSKLFHYTDAAYEGCNYSGHFSLAMQVGNLWLLDGGCNGRDIIVSFYVSYSVIPYIKGVNNRFLLWNIQSLILCGHFQAHIQNCKQLEVETVCIINCEYDWIVFSATSCTESKLFVIPGRLRESKSIFTPCGKVIVCLQRFLSLMVPFTVLMGRGEAVMFLDLWRC